MTKNVGNIDRILRAVAGIGLIGWGYATGNWWGAVGIIPLFTAAISWCPAYPLLGINTCSKNTSAS